MTALAAGAWRILHLLGVACDYWLSMILWLRLEAPMTISSHAGMALRAGEKRTPLALIGRGLNYFWPGHTEGAIAADVARALEAVKRLTNG